MSSNELVTTPVKGGSADVGAGDDFRSDDYGESDRDGEPIEMAIPPTPEQFAGKRWTRKILHYPTCSFKVTVQDRSFGDGDGGDSVVPLRSISTCLGSSVSPDEDVSYGFRKSTGPGFSSKGYAGRQKSDAYEKNDVILLLPSLANPGPDEFVEFYWFIDTSDWTIRQYEDGGYLGDVTGVQMVPNAA